MARNRLPWHRMKYAAEKLREVTLYDLKHGVDTATEEWSGIGAGYQAAYTSEIEHWYDQCAEAGVLTNRDFIDIGCGKGKAMLVWGDRLKRDNVSAKVRGIEADAHLGFAAMRNLSKKGIDHEVAICNALDYDYSKHDRLTLWMFNPFGANTVRELSGRLAGIDTLLIYNNPMHANVLLEDGWYLTELRAGEQGYTTTAILNNSLGF